ncbi:MAG TPA: DUF542 domain-containing protein [Chitinophagaceae bacterium]
MKRVFVRSTPVNATDLVSDIVNKDYRTAEVFHKYNIDFCCGGKRPLESACELMGVDPQLVQKDLEMAMRDVHVPNSLLFHEWDIDFIIAYVINVHHQYLKQAIPATKPVLDEFVISHTKHYPYLAEMQKRFHQLSDHLLSLMKQEEEILFPYIRQLAHAHHDREPYALLLIRTLRKPVEEVLFREHELVADTLLSLREVTRHYTTPGNVCVKHRVVIAKLKELDNDLSQHLYLEQTFLYPQVISIEKELMEQAEAGNT